MRFAPSMPKGLVTTATVRMPSSLADLRDDRRRAGAGAAAHAGGDEQHVAALDRLLDAVAILHRGLPAEIRVGPGAEALGDVAADLDRGLDPRSSSACESVLAQMNSTPSMPHSIMCDTALPPPPPTPMTLITAWVL
jgi:hypothetical protein